MYLVHHVVLGVFTVSFAVLPVLVPDSGCRAAEHGIVRSHLRLCHTKHHIGCTQSYLIITAGCSYLGSVQ